MRVRFAMEYFLKNNMYLSFHHALAKQKKCNGVVILKVPVASTIYQGIDLYSLLQKGKVRRQYVLKYLSSCSINNTYRGWLNLKVLLKSVVSSCPYSVLVLSVCLLFNIVPRMIHDEVWLVFLLLKKRFDRNVGFLKEIALYQRVCNEIFLFILFRNHTQSHKTMQVSVIYLTSSKEFVQLSKSRDNVFLNR